MVEEAVFPDRQTLLGAVKGVLAQYATNPPTLRQAYYRLVAAHIIPNSFRSYKNLGSAMTTWRRDGTIPVDALLDRTRSMATLDTGWRADDPKGWLLAYLKFAVEKAQNYELARWYGQPERVIVAVEKQALEGPFTQVCEELDVDLAVCRGYPSISFLKEFADSVRGSHGRRTTILYFGDHDASGENIPEVVERDLSGLFRQRFEFQKVALTREQAVEKNLIPAPLKLSDSRATRFAEEHGDEVFELDAIEPNELLDMIRDAVNEHFDDDIAEQRDETVREGQEVIDDILEKRGVLKLMEDLKKDTKSASEDEEGGDDSDDDEDDEE